MALRSTDLAILSARFGVARFGASRFGFCPDNVEGVGADEPGEYAWKEDKPPETLWTLQTLFSFCGSRPTCDFDADLYTVGIGGPVQFTDTSTPAELISFWYWTFGDGEVSYEQHPTHSYAASGEYTVTLYVAGIRGSSSCTDEIEVVPGPTAGFLYEDPAAFGTSFTDTSTGGVGGGTIDTWFWQFGDGSTSSEQNPDYNWGETGAFTVTLKVTDDLGASDEYSEVVNV